MKKLISFAISTIIALIVLYTISLILAAIVLVIIGIITWIVKRVKSTQEWTKWEWHRDTTPLITVSSTGEPLFQNQAHWVRFNNFTQTWETKIVTDPIARPFNEVTNLSDAYNLQFR